MVGEEGARLEVALKKNLVMRGARSSADDFAVWGCKGFVYETDLRSLDFEDGGVGLELAESVKKSVESCL